MAIAKRDIVEGPTELKGHPLPELEQLFLDAGERKYRAKQVYDGIYIQRLNDVQEMALLPQELRDRLEKDYRTQSVVLKTVQESVDGTKKFLFELWDGRAVESVLIPSEMVVDGEHPRRLTLCVSTQVGCNLGCVFCATGTLKLARNLTSGEIVDQFLQAQKFSTKPITNIVYMGMGEPMNNYDNVIPGIIRMADEGQIIKLAVSLHATTQDLREDLMPLAKKYPLPELIEALEYYYRKTHKSVTYEYILFDGLNDTLADVKRLGRLARRMPTKVNVIPFHEFDFAMPEGFEGVLKPSSPEQFQWFTDSLRAEDVQVNVRSSAGLDIDAACGQLAFSQEGKGE